MNKTPVNLILVVMLVAGIGNVKADEQEQPSLEFLEFLGEMETQDGKWIDPLMLLDIDETDLKSGEKEEKKDE